MNINVKIINNSFIHLFKKGLNMFSMNLHSDAHALEAAVTRCSRYQRMGMIPVISNVKGAMEAVGGVALVALSTVASVSLGAIYLISRIFSSDRRSMQEIGDLLRGCRFNELTSAEKIKVAAVCSAAIGIFGLNTVYHGLQQQVPIIGNFCYALDVGRSMQNA